MRNLRFAAALCLLPCLGQQSCASSRSNATVPGAPHEIRITLPPGWEKIWDQDPERSLRFWIRDPNYPLASRDIPIFSVEFRPPANREAGAPVGLLLERPKLRRRWGNQEREFAVESKGYACFDDGSGGQFIEYMRVIRRDFSGGQIICEMQSSAREPIFVYRQMLAELCRSAKVVQGRSPHNQPMQTDEP